MIVAWAATPRLTWKRFQSPVLVIARPLEVPSEIGAAAVPKTLSDPLVVMPRVLPAPCTR